MNSRDPKKLKSYEIFKLLGFPPGVLQNIRVKNTLPITKISGDLIFFYDAIRKTLGPNQQKFRFSIDRER